MSHASNPCCTLHFTCVACPIITGPDCVPPNNMGVGQLWYNPCTCTYYFQCSGGFDEDNSCHELTPINYKAGAGIAYSGDCDNGSFISVRIEVDGGLVFTETGDLAIDCAALLANCSIWGEANCAQMIDHCNLWAQSNLLFNENDFTLECVGTGVDQVCTVNLFDPEGFYTDLGAIPDPGSPMPVIVWSTVITEAGAIAMSVAATGTIGNVPVGQDFRGLGLGIGLNGTPIGSARSLQYSDALYPSASASNNWIVVAPGDVLSAEKWTDSCDVQEYHVSYHYVRKF